MPQHAAPLAADIGAWVDEHRGQILDLNRQLVSVPSEIDYPSGHEERVQLLVAEILRDLGCEMDVFLPDEVASLTEHDAYLGGISYEGRPNVVGVKKGRGRGRSLIFSGHADTVPRGRDPWTVDPFSGAVRGDRQYGLGIFDMKGGIAAAIMALRVLEDLEVRLAGDLTIETVVDEESGGANGTLACRLRGYEADAAIIPEPTNMTVCPQNHGGSMFRVHFEGRPGRAFSGEKLVNPTYAAARFLEIFRQYEAYHARKKPSSRYFENSRGLPAYVQGVKAGMVERELFDRVPSSCTVDVWIQCYPETSEEELRQDFVGFYNEKAMEDEVLKQVPPRFEKLIRHLPGTGLPEGHEIVGIATSVAAQVRDGGVPVGGAPFTCDSFVFNRYSRTPALIWGPKGGNPHAPDEFIEIEPFIDLVKMYALTMTEWCGVAA